MLCNMFLYVVQHIFCESCKSCTVREASRTLHFLQCCRPIFALFADACRMMHKMQKLAVAAENFPS